MRKRTILKDDVDYIVFTEIYLRTGDPKFSRRAFQILEAAIRCFARKGWAGVTMAMIARESGVTRPLIRHYFKDEKEVRLLSIKYIRVLFQQFAVQQMQTEKVPEEMLKQYFRACFSWLENYKSHALVWSSFLFSCASSRDMRKVNTEAVMVGTERIAAIVSLALGQGGRPSDESNLKAKLIQIFLTGAMISYVSEDLGGDKGEDRLAFQTSVINHGINILWHNN